MVSNSININNKKERKDALGLGQTQTRWMGL